MRYQLTRALPTCVVATTIWCSGGGRDESCGVGCRMLWRGGVCLARHHRGISLGVGLGRSGVHEFSAPAPSAGPIGAPSAPSLSGDGQATAAPQGSDGAPWPVRRFIDGCEANPAPYSCDPVGERPRFRIVTLGGMCCSIGAAVAALALIGGCAGVGWWLPVRRSGWRAIVEVVGVLVGTDVAVAAGAEELTDLQYACRAAPHPMRVPC
jgi:hypothetical protein